MPVRRLGVIGGGLMGGGIAIDAARHGFQVLVYDLRSDGVDELRIRAASVYERLIAGGRMNEKQAQIALAYIVAAPRLADLAGTDLIIEAVFEDLNVKSEVLQSLSSHLEPRTIVATNTSSLRVEQLAGSVRGPERFLGLHYFSPAEINPLVEVVSGKRTAADTISRALEFLAATGRVPLRCRDTPGFAINRFFCPYYNEAVRIFEEGIAPAIHIDRVAREKIGVAAGPFAVMNLIKPTVAAQAIGNLSQLGPFYRISTALAERGKLATPWEIPDAPLPSAKMEQEILLRLLGAIFLPTIELLIDEVANADDVDKGARLALKFAHGPSSLMRGSGRDFVMSAVNSVCVPRSHPLPPVTFLDDMFRNAGSQESISLP
jgi:3-hydroxybutyryl-CoA dehydrogenase